MKKNITANVRRLGFVLTLCITINAALGQVKKDPVDYVNPYIGNISHLLVPTFPTVHLPNSILRVIPDRADFTSPYLNGLPVFLYNHREEPAFSIKPVSAGTLKEGSRVKYAYDQEKISPYRYTVFLENEGINVHFAPAHQSAIYRFDYESEAPEYYAINAGKGELKAEGNTVSGYQRLGNGNAKAYIYIVFDQQPKSAVINDGKQSADVKATAKSDVELVLKFNKPASNLSLRYGVSFISVEQAKANLENEIPDFNLEQVAAKGRAEWNTALSKISIEGDRENDKVIFYTALYRTYERMISISENGKYFSPFDQQIHADNGVPFFTDDWSWDTYRAAHPLHLLINPQLEAMKVSSYIRSAEQNPEQWMPTFPIVTGDLHAMNGNHAVAVILDAYRKGLKGFDLEKAYALCKRTIMEESMLPWIRGKAGELDSFYKEKGYFPALKPGEKEMSKGVSGGERRQTVAVTLAASYDDWCLAQMAKALGKTDDYQYFLGRSYNYRHLFNPETSFFHPKDAEGKFIEPFDYRFSGGMGARDYYDENNAWTYRWDVQHNIGDLVKLMGGKAKFIQNLDQLFGEPLGRSKYQFYAQLPDQTGNVGQFSMGNEPSLHIPYLYNYAGAPWKTQKRVRSLLEMWFRNDLMGIPGDEDGGGLSAFVVFSAMGFYPVTIGSATYNIGSPLFNKVVLNTGNGKTFVVEAKNCSHENKYIQSAKINGKPLNKPWITHAEIINGGRLELVMGNRPNKLWGAGETDAPPSEEAKP